MKKKVLALFLIVIFMSAANVAYASDFCAGFQRGYAAGYKKASGSALAPLPPLCPLQPLKGFGDPTSDYEHGYLIGLQKGIEDGFRYSRGW